MALPGIRRECAHELNLFGRVAGWMCGFALVALLAACGPAASSQQDIERRIAQGVIGTVAALPSPAPKSTPLLPRGASTATPDLAGLFCEYHFCIGHPPDLSLSDVNDNTNPSGYGQGKVFAFRQDLVIVLAWAQAGGADSPAAAMQALMGPDGDTPTGDQTGEKFANIDIVYLPIKPPVAASTVPFGGMAAWQCGDRIFVWKAYTAQDGQAKELLKDALNRFTCGQ